MARRIDVNVEQKLSLKQSLTVIQNHVPDLNVTFSFEFSSASTFDILAEYFYLVECSCTAF